MKPNSLAHVVSSKINGREHVFQAEVKPLNQILWDAELAPSVLRGLTRSEAPASETKSKPAEPLDDQVGVAEPLPLRGPPRGWIQEHGPTPDCSACNSASRRGKKHSAACCRQYRNWVQAQRDAISEGFPKSQVVLMLSRVKSQSLLSQVHPKVRIQLVEFDLAANSHPLQATGNPRL